MLFCDLGGYTQWNEEEDPEEVARVMEAIRREAVRIFGSYGGIVNQFIGDEIMGLFGVVSAHEDDACRALAAAVALHAFMRSPDAPRTSRRPELRLHSGAETGLIYARANDLRSGLFEVTGDAVNTAARLRSLATTDEVLCGPELQRRVQPYFRLQPLDPVKLHGKGADIVPHRVLGPSEWVSPFDVAALRGLTGYVNRERELRELTGLWGQVERAQGLLVSIGGPAGVGKSRLLHEFRHVVGQGAFVLHGRCSAYRNVAPYQPFIDALSGLSEGGAAEAEAESRVRALGSRYQLSEDTTAALEYLVNPTSAAASSIQLEGDALRAAIIDALGELLVRAAADRPVLAMFEDWHWADEASRAALRQIAQRVQGQRILIAVNYRSTELTEQAQPPAEHHIQLDPLSSPSTEAMARSLLGGDMPPELSAFVHTRTLGNPFFVEEICRELLERGTCRTESDSVVLLRPLFQFRAPSTVQATVRARVDRLPDPQRDLLRWAAVIGQHFDLASLEALAEESDAADSGVPKRARLLGLLESLEAQGLILRDSALPPAYHFKHAITQEVVYENLPVQLRRRHHLRIAREIEVRTPAEQLEARAEALAHHYRSGLEHRKAAEYSVLAGDKAWRSSSLEQAELQYRVALELLAGLAADGEAERERYVDVALKLARAGVYNPHPEQVLALKQSLQFAEQRQDPRRVCLCLNWLSWIEYGRGEQAAAQLYADRFLERARELGDNVLVAQALIDVGRCRSVATDYDRAIMEIEAGLQLRARSVGTAYGYALGTLALAHGDRGEFEAAYALCDRVVAGNSEGQPSLIAPLLIQRAIIECWQGDWDACMATSARAYDLGRRIEGKYILGMSSALYGFARFMGGRSHGAGPPGSPLGSLRQGIQLIETHALRLHLSFTCALLGWALALSGDYGDAELAAQRALERSAEGDRLGEAAALRVLAVVAALRDGQLARAETLLERAVQVGRDKRSDRELALCELTLSQLLRAHAAHARADEAFASAQARAARLGWALPSLVLQRPGIVERQV